MCQYTCPKCGTIGAGDDNAQYKCHRCQDGTIMLKSNNGKIIKMNLEENIARMEQELTDMKRKLEIQKNSKWVMKHADWRITPTGEVKLAAIGEVSATQEFGMKRHTKELAELSANRMKQANLLEYWAMVIDPEWRYEGMGDAGWLVYKDRFGRYVTDLHLSSRFLGQVYMSKKAAREICDALNSGELVL